MSTGREAVLSPGAAPAPGRALLITGGLLVLAIAVVHVGIAIVGPAAYRYFGAGNTMASMAEHGSPVPALVTLAAVVVFALVGLYGLSGGGCLPRLWLLRTGLVFISAIFILRGLSIIRELRILAHHPGALPQRFLVYSALSLAVGLLYLVGTASVWRGLGGRGTKQAPAA